MKITIRNNAKLSKKFLRFINWKLYRMKRKFQHLLYAEVFLNKEGHRPGVYEVNIRLGIPGNDIIIRNKSNDLAEVFRKSIDATHRYLAKYK